MSGSTLAKVAGEEYQLDAAHRRSAGFREAVGGVETDMRGNATYGSYPTLALGGPDDVGQDSWELQGRWIPTTSVDQYAATLLKWFDATDGQLDTVLPNLANFGSARNLGFV